MISTLQTGIESEAGRWKRYYFTALNLPGDKGSISSHLFSPAPRRVTVQHHVTTSSAPSLLWLSGFITAVLNQCLLGSVFGPFLGCNDAWWVFEMWHNQTAPYNEGLVLFFGPFFSHCAFQPMCVCRWWKKDTHSYVIRQYKRFLLLSWVGIYSGTTGHIKTFC